MSTNDRHPEDANLWAIIDNPATSQEDIDTVKNMIACNEEMRARYPNGDIPIPEKFGSKHPDDEKLWAIVDDVDATKVERRSAFDMILKREQRRQPT